MNFIEELKWRGMLNDHSPGVEEALTKGARGYIGFDPTAASLTIGNLVQVMILRMFQLSGHQPIVLMGGATGRIGDPSGKDKERQLKSYDELDFNLSKQLEQIQRLLKDEGDLYPPIMVNNLDHFKEMDVLSFLRDVGKTLTVNYMMSKDSVKNRLESGISFTEFSYQLLQAYDFQRLYEDQDCKIQMGGSDQWGNITAGTEFIRRNSNGKAYAITTPLLTKADGSKFGKSEKGNIWLDANLTSPYQFYQFWVNSADSDLESLVKFFSLKTRADIQAMVDLISTDPRETKRLLAEEMTSRIHGELALSQVSQVTSLLFSKNLDSKSVQEISAEAFEMIAKEIPTVDIDTSNFDSAIPLADLLTDISNVIPSKSDVRRAVKGNALSINKTKISIYDTEITIADFIQKKYMLVENGKKNKFLLRTV